jgi:hypothetical protein
MMGTLIFLFLLYVAAIFVVAKAVTSNRGDFWLIVLFNVLYSPIIGSVIGLVFYRQGNTLGERLLRIILVYLPLGLIAAAALAFIVGILYAALP